MCESTIKYVIKDKLGRYVSSHSEWAYTDHIVNAALFPTRKNAISNLEMPGEKVYRVRYIAIEEK